MNDELIRLIKQNIAKQDALCEQCFKQKELLCEGTRMYVDEEATEFYGVLRTYSSPCPKIVDSDVKKREFDLARSSGIPERYAVKYADDELEPDFGWIHSNKRIISPDDREMIFALGMNLIRQHERYFHIFFPAFVSSNYEWSKLYNNHVGSKLVVFDRPDLVRLSKMDEGLVCEYLSLREDSDAATWFIVDNATLDEREGRLYDMIREVSKR